MRARALLPVASVAALLGPARADSKDPKPAAVDIKPLRDKLAVFEDEHGDTYIAYLPDSVSDARLFFAAANSKAAYEQVIVTRSADGSTGAWDLGMWAPRQSSVSPASIRRDAAGKYIRSCNRNDREVLELQLKQLGADRAKGVIDKLEFRASAIVHRVQLFARDDSGVYYYVDRLAKDFGGKGYRVFSGKKGAMKELPLTDVAMDTAGEVYSTKSGDVRFVKEQQGGKAFWIKGEKRTELSLLDEYANSHLIWSELGIYNFLGTMCDEL